MGEPIVIGEESNLEYGRCIKNIWERAGRTQQEFADLCGKGVSTSTLNVIKRGESLSEEAHEKIVFALNQLALQRGDLPIDGDYLKGLWKGELKGKPGRKPLNANVATERNPTLRYPNSVAVWVALGLSLLLNLWLVMRSIDREPKAFLNSWPELIPVSAGTFMMGLDNSTERNGPRTQMTLTYDFEVGRYEITQEQYEAVMGTNPSRYQGPDLPVDSVEWRSAVRFCEQLTGLARLRGVLRKGYVYRLPTEAEWEYVCRAGGETRFTGTDSAVELLDLAWIKNNSDDRTHPVGSKKPNAWGLYDLHGNVAEWCADGAAPRLPGGTYTNRFIVPKDGFYARAYRGGSHYSHPGLVLVAHRAWRDYADSGAGFRVVLAPPLERLAVTSSGPPDDETQKE